MDPETADIRCIYCKETKPRPARGEHVVLDGLGGTTCIPDVCHECNTTKLARIDQDLLRDSPILLHRLFTMSKRGQAQEPQFLPHSAFGGFLDCTIRTGPIEVLLPAQVFLVNGKLTSLSPMDNESAAQDALRFFTVNRANAKVLHRAVRDTPEHVPARLVMHRKDGKWRFVLRATTDEAAAELLQALDDWPKLYDGSGKHFASSVDTRAPVLRMSTPINSIERCVAKMAFNFLAMHLGASFALRDEFDPIRQYILGENVEPVREVEGPDGEIGFTVDTRFVTPWHDQPATGDGWWVLPDIHTLALIARSRKLDCHVHLFGGRENFIVSLGAVHEDADTRQELPFFLLAHPLPDANDETMGLVAMLVRTGRASPVEAETSSPWVRAVE